MTKKSSRITKNWLLSLEDLDIPKTIEMEGYNPLSKEHISDKYIWAKCPLCNRTRRTPISSFYDGKYCRRHVRTKGLGVTKDIVDYNNISKYYADLFWSRVDKTNDGCWEWTYTKMKKGYGQMKIGGKGFITSRLAWYFTYNKHPPAGLFVCHTCDNPSCCNPAHLFIGTIQDNLKDAYMKGRTVKGERSPKAQLVEKNIIAIRKAHNLGENIKQIAMAYGVSYGCIYSIVKKTSWKHL